MKKDERDRFEELCALIAVEQDRKQFMELVEELNRLLSVKDHRLQDEPARQNDDPRNDDRGNDDPPI